jgi:hypothetical protein
VLTRYVRSFNRFEIKYLVPHQAVRRLLGELHDYLQPDPHCESEWGYPVYSIYWDSDGLSLFWEKIEGLKNRRKLRLRRYADDSSVFIEIKQRTDRTLQKRRVLWPIEQALSILGNDVGGDEDCSEPDDAVLSEALVLRHLYQLRPRMAISYLRRAYFGRFEPDLRVTVDRRVQYLHTQLDIRMPFPGGYYLVDPRLVVMEIKFSDRVPVWLAKAVRRHQLQMVRLSKYCTAVDRTYFGNTLT